MSEIAKTIGQRVRNYRIDKGLSQEKLAELSGCHPTYIGQVERGEKNATLESIEKIASAMNISLAQLFEKINTMPTILSPRLIIAFLSGTGSKIFGVHLADGIFRSSDRLSTDHFSAFFISI